MRPLLNNKTQLCAPNHRPRHAPCSAAPPAPCSPTYRKVCMSDLKICNISPSGLKITEKNIEWQKSVSAPASISFDKPKSTSCTCPCASSKIFSGLRSLCMCASQQHHYQSLSSGSRHELVVETDTAGWELGCVSRTGSRRHGYVGAPILQ